MAGVFQPSNSGFDRASSDPNEFVGDRNGIETPSLPERPNIAEFVDTLTHLKSELAKTGQLDKGKVPEYLLQLQKFSLLVEKYSLNVQQTLGARTNTPTEAQLRQLRQVWGEMTAQLQGADTLSDLLELGTIHVQRYLNADRVLIYRFDTDSTLVLRRDPQGMVVAETLQRGWTPTLGETLPPMCFGRDRPQDYERSPMVSLPDIRTLNLTPYQRQLLERFQVQASLTIPILLGSSIWGLLVAHQCASARQWTEVEMTLLNQLSIYLTARLQEYDFSDRLRQQTEADRTISQIIERIRQSSDLDTIFKTTVREVRRLMGADRVGVFQFYPDAGYDDGEFVAEDVQSGYPSAVAAKIHDHCFGSQYAAQYASGRIQAVADIYNANFSDCHISVLSQFEVRANLIVPLLQNNQLWGLLCVHQCSAPREWQDEDLELAKRIATQFTIALQQAQTVAQLRQQSEKAVEAQSRDRAVLQIIERIRQSLDLDNIFKTTVREIRRLLEADRVGVFQFYPDAGYDDGEFVAEDVQSGYPSAVAAKIHDHCFGSQYADKYADGRIQAVADIHNAGLSDCHISVLSQFGVRANLIVPLLQNNQLWGLLCVQQCSAPREWQAEEIDFVKHIAAQFTLALQQAEYVGQLQANNEEVARSQSRDRAVSQIIERIRQSLDLDNIFKTTVREIRRLLEADRVGVFQFYPDAGYDDGEFVAEDVQSGYPSAIAAKIHDHCFGNQFADKYIEGRIQSVADIHNAGLSDCHIEVLSQFGVRANLIVPLLKGKELWGLLCVHQCSAPREWQAEEIDFVKRIAAQFTIALQQVEYLKQLEVQSQQLTEAAEQAKAARTQIQQRAIALLMAVRPALDGDLTVRAPITEDEIGTLADMYNNTIQSLRKIVLQVQGAAEQVVQTSLSSGASLMQLSGEAQKQFQEISRALDQIQEMVNFTQETAANAQQVEQALEQASITLETGDKAMNRTVEGIMEIRKTVGEAVKRIKRLDKSSESIAKVVNLINNFATQTRLLAMNAAIEATRAGEYGRGFAVVADEVRSLAQQSSDATTEIEKLVQEIQMETKAVRGVMDIANQRVVAGTNLVGETWKSLNEVVEAAGQIGELVQGITHATQVQTEQAQSVTQRMQEIAAIADQTSKDSIQISASFKDALTTAQDLQSSAGRFKVS
jgi:methyl-accepting chemotaxis protein PixJ